MSTIAYAQITNRREASVPGTSTDSSKPGLRTYIDAFAALVPAEVLTLHAVVISMTTETVKQASAGGGQETITRMLPGAAPTLEFAFWAIVVASLALYVVPRWFGGHWDRWDAVRALIAPLAFVGWTMLQRATAFDAAFPDMDPLMRSVGAVFLGALLGAVSAGLAMKADAKPA